MWRDRHLGLVPVAEHPSTVRRSLRQLAAAIAERFDLQAIEAMARAADPVAAPPVAVPAYVRPCRIAVAAGRAFTFSYTDNIEALEAAGAEIVPFDPLHDRELPESIDGLVIGGGFPEVYGEELAANVPLLSDAADRIGAGLPTWAECGGLLWLARELDGRPMVGAVPARARLGDRLVLGYRDGRTTADSPLGPGGTTMRGHEFHYSTCEPGGDALELSSRFGRRTDGFATSTLLATYLHHHGGGNASIIGAFVRSCCNRNAVPTARLRGVTDA